MGCRSSISKYQPGEMRDFHKEMSKEDVESSDLLLKEKYGKCKMQLT
jgi:hypothetical protein